jgi:hypothetical protein
MPKRQPAKRLNWQTDIRPENQHMIFKPFLESIGSENGFFSRFFPDINTNEILASIF